MIVKGSQLVSVTDGITYTVGNFHIEVDNTTGRWEGFLFLIDKHDVGHAYEVNLVVEMIRSGLVVKPEYFSLMETITDTQKRLRTILDAEKTKKI